MILLKLLYGGGGAAKAAGLSFLQTNVLIQALAQSGIKMAKAGTAMNSVIARLEKQGIDFRKIKLPEIFSKMRKEIEALPDSQQRVNRELQLFGMHHKKSGFAILQNSARLKDWLKLMDNTNTAQEQADIRLKSLRTLFGRLGTTIEDKIFKVFEKIEPVLSALIIDFTRFIDSIDPRQIKDMANAISTLAAAIRVLGTFLMALIDPLIFLSNIFTLPDFNLLDLDKGISERTRKIRELIRADKPEELRLLLEKGKEGAGAAGANGRVSLDINLKGNTEALASVQTVSEGDVDVNVGKNLAFIG